MNGNAPILLPELQYRDAARLFTDEQLSALLGSIVRGVESLISARGLGELAPDVAAWAGHGIGLCSYGMSIAQELRDRGLSGSNPLARMQYLCAARNESPEYPRWTYDESVIQSHRAALQNGTHPFFPDSPIRALYSRDAEFDGEEESFFAFRPSGPFHQIYGWFWVDHSNRPNKQWLRGTTEGMHQFVGGALQGMELETQELMGLPDSELSGYVITDSDETMLGDPILVWRHQLPEAA